jgi:type IV secretion system protein TrbL
VSCSANPLSWGGCVGDAIGGALGSAGKAVAGGVFDSIAHAFGDAATSAVNWLWGQIGKATAIDLTGTGIKNLLAITGAIAVIVALAMFAIQVIACALRQDFGGLGRAVRGMLVAFVGAAFAIASTQLLLVAVDDLSNGVVRAATGENVTGVGQKLVLAQALDGLNSAGLFLMSIVLLISVVVIWCALMIRKMLIIVAAVFGPVAFSGATSDLTKGWVRHWIEFTVALICSKLILVLIFIIGLAMVNGAGSTGADTDQVTNLAIGALTLLLAGFAPWLAIKMVHFTGDAFHHVHAQAAAAQSGVVAVVAAPQKAGRLHAQTASMFSPSRQAGQASNGNGPTATRNGWPGPGAAGPPSSGTSGSPTGAGAVAVAAEAVRLPGRGAQAIGHQVDDATPQVTRPPRAEPPRAEPPKASPPKDGDGR